MAQMTPKSVFTSASGLSIPVFGLGTWQSTDQVLEEALDAALEAGYRLIDTAFVYGNEMIIGKVLARWFSSNKLKREEVFITTKLPFFANNPKYVREYLEKQLKALKLDYVDLYLIHHPIGLVPEEVERRSSTGGNWNEIKLDMSTDHVAIWKEMEKQVDDGLTRAVGLSNFNIRQIERILEIARIMPANLQIELHLYLQCKAEQEFCRNKGITITSYGTLGSPGAPKELFNGANLNPMVDPVVIRIADAYGKTASQVLLRHILQSGVAVIPKSSNPERIRQNMQVFDFELSNSEMEELNSLDKGEVGRRFIIDALRPHPEYPYTK